MTGRVPARMLKRRPRPRVAIPLAWAIWILWPLPAAAQSEAATQGCPRLDLGHATVRQIADPATLGLDDGRTVQLAGIGIPDDPALAQRAKVAAERLILDKSVVLNGVATAPDRYGRVVAFVGVGTAGLERSVQYELVRTGLARIVPSAGDRRCLAPLLAAERQARDGKLGLWADPRYATRRADDPAAILSDRGRFTLVEGRVLSVRESGGTIYINFGRRWSEDFTVTILKRSEGAFTASGLEPKRLERQRVRVRGIIEERGGPWIEATRPEQIEVLHD